MAEQGQIPIRLRQGTVHLPSASAWLPPLQTRAAVNPLVFRSSFLSAGKPVLKRNCLEAHPTLAHLASSLLPLRDFRQPDGHSTGRKAHQAEGSPRPLLSNILGLCNLEFHEGPWERKENLQHDCLVCWVK